MQLRVSADQAEEYRKRLRNNRPTVTMTDDHAAKFSTFKADIKTVYINRKEGKNMGKVYLKEHDKASPISNLLKLYKEYSVKMRLGEWGGLFWGFFDPKTRWKLCPDLVTVKESDRKRYIEWKAEEKEFLKKRRGKTSEL